MRPLLVVMILNFLSACTETSDLLKKTRLTEDDFRNLRSSGVSHDELVAAGHSCSLPPIEGVFLDEPDDGGFELTGNEAFELESLPGADAIIYLDFTGHLVTGTPWNSSYNGGAPIDAQPYDFNGNPSVFSTAEKDRIIKIWRRVAEDFLPYNINVTTKEPTVDDLRRVSDPKYGIRVIITPTSSWYGSAGGVAYVGSFDWGSDTPVWVFENLLGNGNEKFVAEAISHEVGHSLGLSHDGPGYYSGHGSGAIGWAPIMGNPYYKELTQWSKGEYSGASNTQDDLAIIASTNGPSVGYLADDVADTISEANTAPAFSFATDYNRVIETAADADVFKIVASSAGDLTVTAFDHTDFFVSPNLDRKITLYNASQVELASDNPTNALTAAINNFNITTPGTYFVKVEGVGNANASDYGSVGGYVFRAEFSGGGGNQPPVANNDSATTNEDTSETINVLANDTDPESDPLTITSVSNPPKGDASISGSNIIYNPDSNEVGSDSFTYTISDGQGNSAVGTVNITITPVNDAPDAVNDSVVVNEDAVIDIVVLSNDTDVDGDSLSVTGVGLAANGNAVEIAGNKIRYTPNANFNGADSFSYTISDGNGGTDTATVNVTVNPVNDAPNAVNDSVAVNEDSSIDIVVLSNDSDIDGNPLSVSSVGSASNGSAVEIAGNKIRYTPNSNFNGSDSFAYTISDGAGGSDTATVSVTVNSINDAPTNVTLSGTSVTENNSVPTTIGNLSSSDVDSGDSHSYSLVSGAGDQDNGSFIITGSQLKINVVADREAKSSYSVRIRTQDAVGLNFAKAFVITVNNQNEAPTDISLSANTVAENNSTGVTIGAFSSTDPDTGDTHSYSLVGGAGAADNGSFSIDGANLKISIVTDYEVKNAYSIRVRSTDSGSLNHEKIFSVLVTNVNEGPDAINDSTAMNEDGGTIVIDVLANDTDPESDSLTITAVGTSSGGSIVNNGSNVSFTPNLNYNGVASFSYTITDGSSSDSATVSVTVNPVNDNPIANDDSASTMENNSVTISALNNDSDVDLDTLSVASFTQPANGAVTILGVTFTYTPNTDYNGVDTFTYVAGDGNGGTSNTATVTVNVTNVNSIPDAVNDSIATNEDTVIIYDVVANDTDADGDNLVITVVGSAANGNASKEDDKQIRYQPNANFNGSDSFTYTISDGKGGTDTATVSVTVNPVNDAPDAVMDSASVAEDGSVLIDVLGNDGDIDGDVPTIASSGSGANGSTNIEAGKIRYSPGLNYNGSDSFSYTISDGNGGTDSATVNVTVTPVNDNPVAVDDSASTDENTSVDIDVVANDSDIDGDSLSISNVTTPGNGSTTNDSTTITYTPAGGFSGTDSFSYTVSDGNGGAATATVTVTVNPAPALSWSDPVAIKSSTDYDYGNQSLALGSGILLNSYHSYDRFAFRSSLKVGRRLANGDYTEEVINAAGSIISSSLVKIDSVKAAIYYVEYISSSRSSILWRREKNGNSPIGAAVKVSQLNNGYITQMQALSDVVVFQRYNFSNYTMDLAITDYDTSWGAAKQLIADRLLGFSIAKKDANTMVIGAVSYSGNSSQLRAIEYNLTTDVVSADNTLASAQTGILSLPVVTVGASRTFIAAVNGQNLVHSELTGSSWSALANVYTSPTNKRVSYLAAYWSTEANKLELTAGESGGSAGNGALGAGYKIIAFSLGSGWSSLDIASSTSDNLYGMFADQGFVNWLSYKSGSIKSQAAYFKMAASQVDKASAQLAGGPWGWIYISKPAVFDAGKAGMYDIVLSSNYQTRTHSVRERK